MPKVTEEKDGSETESLKPIMDPFSFPHLATAKPNFSAKGPLPMKRTVRPLFLLLLILVFAATLTSRAIVRRGILSIELESRARIRRQPPPPLNATLLRHAAVEIGEEKFKHEVQSLLDGNFGGQARQRTFVSWRRFIHHERGVSAANANLPATLRSPLFYRYWLDFRKVLHDWFRKRRFQPGIMSELTRSVKVPIDSHNKVVTSSNKYSSCAVVGNSGILLNRDYGSAIDAHEYYSLKRFVEESGKGLEKWGEAHDGALFHYSSGMQAVMLALGICDRVSIYGFGKSTSAKHHYHTNQKTELHLHDYEAEYAFYRDLVDGHRPIPFLEDRFKVPPVVMYH
uniref:Uncharacterized protein n=1 Tax=Cajanus cajan TaxID=3821 RepID=A0A151TNV3_CAJCA|nr:hypothetical protein KK1_022386 [Cajanus cajan]